MKEIPLIFVSLIIFSGFDSYKLIDEIKNNETSDSVGEPNLLDIDNGILNDTLFKFKTTLQEDLFSFQNSNCESIKDTPRTVTALFLANETFFKLNTGFDKLLKKQLELEIALTLASSRRHIDDFTAGKLALYINALISVCINPYNFYDFNLIKIIKKIKVTSDYENALKILALCNANHSISKHDTLVLGRFLQNDTNVEKQTDTAAITLMALACNAKLYQNTYISKVIKESVQRLKNLQNDDGSFGNVFTTALVVQALIAAKDIRKNWSFYQAIDYIKLQYEENKFYSNIVAYYFVLPLLNLKSMADLKKSMCSWNSKHTCLEKKSLNTDLDSENEIWLRTQITVTYSLKCDFCDFQNFTISTVVGIEHGETLLNVMEQTVHADKRFLFTTKNSSFGIFIHSVAALESGMNNMYWFIYQENRNGIKDYKLVNKGISEIKPEDGDHYILWYKKLTY